MKRVAQRETPADLILEPEQETISDLATEFMIEQYGPWPPEEGQSLSEWKNRYDFAMDAMIFYADRLSGVRKPLVEGHTDAPSLLAPPSPRRQK